MACARNGFSLSGLEDSRCSLLIAWQDSTILLFPTQVKIILLHLYSNRFDYWNPEHGLSMSVMRHLKTAWFMWHPNETLSYNPAPAQPEFASLDLSTCANPLTSSEYEIANCFKKLAPTISGQYLEDQLLQVDRLSSIFGKRQKLNEEADSCWAIESWNEEEQECNFSRLAEAARENWDETRQSWGESLLRSCCTSMFSTVASASSTVASASFTLL